MMRRIAVLLVLTLVMVVPAEASFRSIAHAIDARLGSRTWIPFLGFARFAVWMVSPSGVHDFQLAVWEGKSARLDGHDLEQLVRREMDKGFAPLVRVRSNRSGEHVFIYAKALRNDLVELLILTHERDDTVLVRVTADASIVARDFGHPRKVAKLAQR